MKIFIHYLLVILLSLIVRPAAATQPYPFSGNTAEKVVLSTDRSIYIAGEQIQFSATLFNSEAENIAALSKIMYCELITPNGKVIANNKFSISNSISSGCINIPIEIFTGTYYIRAYTKRMREYGPLSYEYRQIRLINPNRPDVLSAENNQTLPVQQFTQVQPEGMDNLLSVFLDKAVYTPRDTINFAYEQINGSKVRIKSMCISVIPESAKSLMSKNLTPEEKVKFIPGFYPETRGLSLSGRLTEASSTIPVIDKKVNLSIIGEGRDFMAVRTDSSGYFYFALPDYLGSRDLFLCAEKTPSQVVKIWVDNDFCTTPIHLPSPVFALSDKERQLVRDMAQNVQINSYFQPAVLSDSLGPLKDTNAFYGKPTTILYIEKYIMLPTLDEYFNELPSQVKVRKRKGESYFAVQGSANIRFYDPLVLVDWVAVDEPSKILAATPQNFSRIEVVNEDYLKGGQIYGGIISFISKKGDFAGIDLPSAGIFVNYRFLAENQCTENINVSNATHPDSRNTILWKPGVNIQIGKPEKLIFTAPDTPGKYSVVMEGITVNGELFSITSPFEVNN